MNPYQPPLTETLVDGFVEARHRFDCPHCYTAQSYPLHFAISPFGRCTTCRGKVKLRIATFQRILRVASIGLMLASAMLWGIGFILAYLIWIASMIPIEFCLGWFWSRLETRGSKNTAAVG